MTYATGKNALARCPRCGDKVRYLDMVDDGQIPGQRVCPGCRDEKHPAERPFKSEDSIVLRRPSPDTDNDGTVSGTSLAETLWPTERYFGGDT